MKSVLAAVGLGKLAGDAIVKAGAGGGHKFTPRYLRTCVDVDSAPVDLSCFSNFRVTIDGDVEAETQQNEVVRLLTCGGQGEGDEWEVHVVDATAGVLVLRQR